VCSLDGETLLSDRDAVDVIGEALQQRAELVVIPVERLDKDFFRLKTGIAGAFVQKFVTYGRRLAIVGDISRHLLDSAPLRDFVAEANRGNHLWFLTNHEELESRLRSRHLFSRNT